ncbi:hypothetical protein LXG23DRAFT_53883 [Yarrowia lipolytica]|jgi:hypothetical protein|uniref:DUF7729 domain-containing protein n=1 Tax=Yarrowia lipolytica TaxID=4952 RepID=A0A1H6Q0K5_YARLL|nr:hypothetical protein YALI1_E24824g [Yarrowia lipolytica]KAB8286049.1 hypothetical protein BKA91DRAFT_132600 [Yarrowia lipolytica]KAE8171641.1 hypothetical protein BKA90DRAFT_138682 [Yarrowia lipolytica]KAJ8057180.1 hypothetical protein LXG23DRAFT_53883 [Yarrowia lipolytica]QNQ00034.1 Hypothetical protein YALI2_E01349g [Yarrowia lipolytica]
MTILPANRMPRIFDSALGRSFSSTTCPQFFDQMLTNKTFTECFPMSFYLQSSSSYVATIRSATNNTKPLEDILDTSCNGISSFSDCTAIMNDLAQRMMQNATCGLDHQRNNSNVVQAYSNLVAYPVVYQTTCLKTDVSNSPAGVPTSPQNNGTEYCYINALYNEELASESFLYLLALGTSFPTGPGYGSPSCSDCTRQVMQIYHTFTGDPKQPIRQTYEGAARVIDQNCSAGFAPPDLLETEEKNNSKANAGVRTAHPTSIVNMLILSLFLSAVFTIL